MASIRDVSPQLKHSRNSLLATLIAYKSSIFVSSVPFLGMVDQVREEIEQANKRAYRGKEKVLRFYYGKVTSEKGTAQVPVSG